MIYRRLFAAILAGVMVMSMAACGGSESGTAESTETAQTEETKTEETKEETPSEGKLTWQQQKEEQARKRKQENELKKVEKRIEELETRDKEIDDTLVLPDVCTNVGRCAELSREKDKIQAELEELYEKWEELA